MLALDSPEWSRLRHCYGPADDIPPLLRALERDPRPRQNPKAEPWFALWSSLCHQDDAYEASYAAVPHIVQVAATTAGPIDFSFFALPASIEIARLTGRAPTLREEFSIPYFAALRDLHRVAFLHASDPWDRPTIMSTCTALAVSKGDLALAKALMNLDDDYIAHILADDR